MVYFLVFHDTEYKVFIYRLKCIVLQYNIKRTDVKDERPCNLKV